MATVYLCIGTQKTGTTTLQKFMAGNAEALGKQGYCYPLMPHLGFEKAYDHRNAHFLAYKSKEDTLEKRREAEKQVRAAGYETVAKMAEKYPNIILSDETLWYISARKNFMANLMRDLGEIGCDVKIVVYLRRQDLLLQSLWNQRVKAQQQVLWPFEAYIKEKGYSYFPVDYYQHLKMIEGYTGKENLLVRVFERGQFEGEGNTLLSDFFQTIGVHLTDEFVDTEMEENFGLSGNYIEMKQIINEIPDYREMDDFVRAKLTIASTYAASRYKEEKTSMMSYEEQKAFMQQFEEGNRKAAQEFLGRKDGILFREPIRNLPKWQVREDTMYRDLLILMVEMFCKYEKKIDSLNSRIAKLEKNDTVGKLESYMAKGGKKISKKYWEVKKKFTNG